MRQLSGKGCHGSLPLGIADVESALSLVFQQHILNNPLITAGENRERATPVGRSWYCTAAWTLRASERSFDEGTINPQTW